MKASSDDKLPQMNEAIAFDTLRFAKYLAKNGFTEQQAETMAEAQVKFLNANLANLATKADIANMATKADIADMATKTDLAQVRRPHQMDGRGWVGPGDDADDIGRRVYIVAVVRRMSPHQNGVK